MANEYEEPLADDSATRVTIWDPENNRKIGGKASPTKGNLAEYFQKYPKREVYTNQKKKEEYHTVSSPSPSPARSHHKKPTPIKTPPAVPKMLKDDTKAPCVRCKRGAGVCVHVNSAGHLDENGERVPNQVPKKQQIVSKAKSMAGGASPRTPIDRSGRGALSLPTQPTPIKTPVKTPKKTPPAVKKPGEVEVEMIAPGSGGATVKWSDDEINRLKIAMAAARGSVMDWEQVSKQVGRTPSACSTRAIRLKRAGKSDHCNGARKKHAA